MATSTVRSPLSILEAPAVWTAWQREVLLVIVGTIRKMGLGNARKRVSVRSHDGFGRGPGSTHVRLALIDDIGLHERICETVWAEFAAAVCGRTVWHAHAGGWLNTATRRATWRLATERAAELFAEVQPLVAGDDPVARVASNAPLPDELLDSGRLRAVATRLLAELTVDELDLLGLGDGPRDYEALAARAGCSIGTLRKRAFDLRARLRARMIAEVGDDEIAAE